ncbi:MAG: divalent metal cation transporter [Gemmatimonadaceae bacterium]|nr:divalent metal cation transporter [Gemmatimonadota bacterium]MCC7322753.1 divalent metal cation transporter [Gemmatimonadaceae bacterium]MBK7832281.1 divalent metal cation transporter [Gemmatimonadota bacterium]MBK8058036.1 divalent metal cation transporter [Gemmatimonadota bacterium]MBK9980165.1 divalent metal cation transporter [Gemmatimonadota bacterium]
MATSAIGPGFLTQTAVFTERLGASFGFVILMSILLDLGAQLTTWRVIAAANRRAQDVANLVLPGLGTFLVALVAIGGLAFNIGNVAGAGLGLNVLLGVPVTTGAVVSAAIAIALFLVKEAGRAMDRFAQFLGFVMVGLTVYVAIASTPPIGEAVVRTIVPERVDVFAIVTLVGGTVGGYITFAGAHRLLDAGIGGAASIPAVTRSAGQAIGIASLMRVLLFLAALGVVSKGGVLDAANPPASVFKLATGAVGYRLFGIVMWAAAITSVVGAAYTSVSFLRSVSGWVDRSPARVIIAFIVVSTGGFLLVGRPVKTLILVGSLNGLILPVAVASMLMAARRRDIVGDYRHPPLLFGAGWLVAVSMAAMGAYTLVRDIPALLTR